MFIEKITFEGINKAGHSCKRVILKFNCDTCKRDYESVGGKRRTPKSGRTFCSNKCKFQASKKGEILYEDAKKTSLERYGNEIPMLSAEIKERRNQTLQERYGVTAALQIEAAKEKRRQTNIERYGFAETFQIKEFKEKREATWLANYGVTYRPFPENAVEKAKESMTKFPQKWSSKIELKFYDELCKHFGVDDVVHQKWINGWPIDFYVKSIDVYIQFDGIYWHALDMPLEEIRKSEKPRDKTRVQKWERDREQDDWFQTQCKQLVRITDVEWGKQDQNVNIKEFLQKKICKT